MISRSSWGARPPDSRSFLSSVNRVFIHYTGMDADEQENHVNCAGRVRGIQRYHMDTNGWADIAYSFIVCKHGFIFEGRGFDVRTAATGPCNDDSLAVCFLGDDSVNRDDVTDAGRRAIADAIASIERRKGNVTVHGHRDCMSTSCPGDQLYQWLRAGLPELPEEEEDMATPEETWGFEFPYAGANVRAQTYLGRAYANAKAANERAARLEAQVAALTELVERLEQPAQVSAEAIADLLAARLQS